MRIDGPTSDYLIFDITLAFYSKSSLIAIVLVAVGQYGQLIMQFQIGSRYTRPDAIIQRFVQYLSLLIAKSQKNNRAGRQNSGNTHGHAPGRRSLDPAKTRLQSLPCCFLEPGTVSEARSGSARLVEGNMTIGADSEDG